MSTVVMHNVVSVDGYIADDNDDVGPLFEWYFNGDHPLTPGEMDEPSPGGLRVSKASYDYIRATSVGRPSRWVWWTRWRWTSYPWCSAPASDTSGRSTASTCWRTPTWSSGATGCCTCATGFVAEVTRKACIRRQSRPPA